MSRFDDMYSEIITLSHQDYGNNIDELTKIKDKLLSMLEHRATKIAAKRNEVLLNSLEPQRKLTSYMAQKRLPKGRLLLNDRDIIIKEIRYPVKKEVFDVSYSLTYCNRLGSIILFDETMNMRRVANGFMAPKILPPYQKIASTNKAYGLRSMMNSVMSVDPNISRKSAYDTFSGRVIKRDDFKDGYLFRLRCDAESLDDINKIRANFNKYYKDDLALCYYKSTKRSVLARVSDIYVA